MWQNVGYKVKTLVFKVNFGWGKVKRVQNCQKFQFLVVLAQKLVKISYFKVQMWQKVGYKVKNSDFGSFG